MATKAMDYRCWVFDESGPHYKTADEARGNDDDLDPRQLTAPCHLVVCDTPDCGETLESIDEGWTIHLAAPADAEDEAVGQGWTADGGDLRCFYCEEEKTQISDDRGRER